MRSRVLLPVTLLAIAAAIVPSPCRAEREWGVYVSGSRAPLVGSSRAGFDSTLGRSPFYTDIFDTGSGVRLGVFRAFLSDMRWEAGLVYDRWGGRLFSSDVLPEGATFSDLSIAGVAGGLKIRFLEGHALRVIALGHAGVVAISSVDVTVAGEKQPYWRRTRSVFFDLGVGIECRLHRRVSLVADFRIESFGRPEPDGQSPVRADADEASAYAMTFGLEILLNRTADARPRRAARRP